MNSIREGLEAIKIATLIGTKDVLTLDECCMLTGYSKSMLYTFTSKRVIPHFKRGKHLFFSKQQIQDWLTANPVPTTTEIEQDALTYTAFPMEQLKQMLDEIKLDKKTK